MFIRPTLFALLLLSTTAIQSRFIVGQALAQEVGIARSTDLLLPHLESARPEFCRVLFPGSEPATAILLIIDGSTLYVDRNANGDITEDNERVQAERNSQLSERDHLFKIGEIKVGNHVHESMNLLVVPLENYDRNISSISQLLKTNPQANAYQLWGEIQREQLVGSGNGGRVVMKAGIMDTDGILQFGPSPELTPLIDFAGPLEVRLLEETRLRPGSDTEVVVAAGTKGTGPGTFSVVSYENVIPENVWPRLTLTTNSSDGGPPIVAAFELPHRC